MIAVGMSKEASTLINDQQFESNGCGSGLLSKLACSALMNPFSQELRDGLAKCWEAHDAEYTISTKHKSPKHKKYADWALRNNMESMIKIYGTSSSYEERFVRYVITALLWGGDRAYWNKKASSWGIVPNAATTVSILAVVKFFDWL